MNDEQFEKMLDEIYQTPEVRKEIIKRAIEEFNAETDRLMWNDPPPRIPGVDKRKVFFRPNQKIGQMTYVELITLIMFMLTFDNLLLILGIELIFHKL